MLEGLTIGRLFLLAIAIGLLFTGVVFLYRSDGDPKLSRPESARTPKPLGSRIGAGALATLSGLALLLLVASLRIDADGGLRLALPSPEEGFAP